MTLLPKVASSDRELAAGAGLLFLISGLVLFAGIFNIGLGLFAVAMGLRTLRG